MDRPYRLFHEVETDDVIQRGLTLVQMFAVAAMAANAKDALDSRSSAGFAAAYAAVRFILVAQYFRARQVPDARPLATRYLAGHGSAALLWLTSAFVPAPERFWLWGVAFALDLGTPWLAVRHSVKIPLDAAHLVAAAVALESMGIPAPGETALVTAAIFAGTTHRLNIAFVIIAAATGAIVGDNLGNVVGRWFGYTLLLRYGHLARLHAGRIKLGQFLFARHGGKVVFFGRFVAVLRALAALLAGINCMDWRRFFLFNASGDIVWAAGYGFAAYFFGERLESVRSAVAVTGILLAATACVGGIWWTAGTKRHSKPKPSALYPVRCALAHRRDIREPDCGATQSGATWRLGLAATCALFAACCALNRAEVKGLRDPAAVRISI